MSEGEFYKRIFPPKPEDWDKTHPNQSYWRTINSANNTWAILDEAKKEFPKIDQAHLKLIQTIPNFAFHPNFGYILLRELNKEQEEWFLKWFGDKKE